MTEWTPSYSRWRHGGWYVGNVRYPSGACGCVSNNYEDKKWRIACSGTDEVTFPSRDAAARAEYVLAKTLCEQKVYVVQGEHPSIPGRSMTVHHSRSSAETEAADLVRIICEDVGHPLPKSISDWERTIEAIVRSHPEADVWITEIPVQDDRTGERTIEVRDKLREPVAV